MPGRCWASVRPRPRLSWTVPAADPDFAQDAYELELTRAGRSEPETVRVESREQVLVPWPFAPLRSRESVGGAGPGGRRRRLERLEPGRRRGGGAAVGRRLDRGVRQSGRHRCAHHACARAHVRRPRCPRTWSGPGSTRRRTGSTPHTSTDGVSATRCSRRGGRAIRTGCATRPTTSPTSSEPGDNVLEVLLGNGWYRGRLGFAGKRAFYGDRLALLAQLEVTTSDGAVHVLATDGTWTAEESGIVSDDLYDGQRTDLRTGRDREQRQGRRGVDRPDRVGGAAGPAGPGHRGAARPCGLRLPVRQAAGRLRPERRRSRTASGAWAAGGSRGGRASRGGAGRRRARHPPAAHGRGDRQLRPRGHGGGGGPRTGADLPRLPLRRGHRSRRAGRRATSRRW